MTDTDIRLLIGNRMSNLYITIERLMRNDFPRGIFNEYREAISDISELEEYALNSQFLSVYKEDLKRQVTVFKDTEMADVVQAISQHDTPTNLKAWCQKLLISNLPGFIKEERVYINELLGGRSRKKTKVDYLQKTENNFDLATEVLANNNKSGDTVFQDVETLKRDISNWKFECR